MIETFSGRERAWYDAQAFERGPEISARNEAFNAELRRRREAGLYDAGDGVTNSAYALVAFAKRLVADNGFSRGRLMDYFERNWSAPKQAANQLATIAHAPPEVTVEDGAKDEEA